jgi:hypothetical protein
MTSGHDEIGVRTSEGARAMSNHSESTPSSGAGTPAADSPPGGQFQVPPGASVVGRKASSILDRIGKGRMDPAARRGSVTANASDQVKVTYWTTTYQQGQLQSMAVVDPVDPTQMIFNLSVSVLSADQSTIYVSAWGIPEINDDQPFSPGVGLATAGWTDLFDISKNGLTVTAEIWGVVGTPDNEQIFQITTLVNLTS